ncbi:hypothetical protein ACGF1Z_20350 [Streptomyces sp. NPDC048018]|uniref:hypothetical protein n=1 Tax=Streptomyces sp. NPDC048018 TaxID=3365499 RepID=UPI003722AA01
MGWSFTLHAGLAAGLGAVLLVLAGLTWLPGTLHLTTSGRPMAAIMVLLTFSGIRPDPLAQENRQQGRHRRWRPC